MRKTVLLAAGAALFLAFPAGAMTPGQATCPDQLAPKDLGAKIVSEMINYTEGADTDPALSSALQAIDNACVAREKVPDSQHDTYTRYIIARVSYLELQRQLAAMKVPIAVIDQVFGIGLGKTNPTPDKVTEAQFNTLVEEFTKAGVPVDQMPENALGLMGAYVTVAGEMYRDQAAIR